MLCFFTNFVYPPLYFLFSTQCVLISQYDEQKVLNDTLNTESGYKNRISQIDQNHFIDKKKIDCEN